MTEVNLVNGILEVHRLPGVNIEDNTSRSSSGKMMWPVKSAKM